MTWLALVLALGLVAVHLFIGRLHVLDVIPRSRWLSLAGGTAALAGVQEARLERSGEISIVKAARAPAVLDVAAEDGVQTVRIRLE